MNLALSMKNHLKYIEIIYNNQRKELNIHERRTDMRKIILFAVMAAFVAAVGVPIHVQAADNVKGEVVMKVGDKVSLFHSGTADVKKEICIGDTLTVYRGTGKTQQQNREVGQVKVLGYEGEHYFDARVLKGDIKPGDVTMKKGVYCMVQKPS